MTDLNRQRAKYILADYVTASIGFFVFDIARFFMVSPTIRPSSLNQFLTLDSLIAEQILVPFGIVLLYLLFGAYNKDNTTYKSRLDETLSIAEVSLIAVLAVFFIALVNDNVKERATSYELMASMWLCLFLPTYIARMVMVSRAARRFGSGKNIFKVVVIGANSGNERRLERIVRGTKKNGMRIVTCINDEDYEGPSELCGVPVVKGNDIAQLCRQSEAQGIILMPSAEGLGRTSQLINKLYPLELPIYVTPDLRGMLALRPKVSTVVGEPLVDITKPDISPAAANFKRLGDIVVSACALFVLSPLLVAIAIAVKIDSSGPVLYRQQRVGRHKKPFIINKFRTMQVDAEPTGPALSVPDDPRITRLGHILRKYRLDELPQFWNVLIGNMSLVGPRPEREYYLSQMTARHPSCSLVHRVRPGITSWGMVKYGYASNVDQMLERLEYDLIYVDNVSLGVDLKILFYTVSTVLTGKGI